MAGDMTIMVIHPRIADVQDQKRRGTKMIQEYTCWMYRDKNRRTCTHKHPCASSLTSWSEYHEQRATSWDSTFLGSYGLYGFYYQGIQQHNLLRQGLRLPLKEDAPVSVSTKRCDRTVHTSTLHRDLSALKKIKRDSRTSAPRRGRRWSLPGKLIWELFGYQRQK